MKVGYTVMTVALACLPDLANAFQLQVSKKFRSNVDAMSTSLKDDLTTGSADTGLETSTNGNISKLRFREVRRELERRNLDTSGTFTDMKKRLLLHSDEKQGSKHTDENKTTLSLVDEGDLNAAFEAKGITFQNKEDADFDFNNMVQEVLSLSEKVHWKSAARRFKQLIIRFGHASPAPRDIPEEVFTKLLKAYMQCRLHGSRAAEPARRAMEEMVSNGFSVPSDVANSCIKDSIGYDKDGSHEGFGGIDTALAMLTAIELSKEATPISVETYEKLIIAMAREGSVDDALQLLRKNIVEKSSAPSLGVFADVASACIESNNEPEKVMTGLAYIKATGYELDNIASTVDGRRTIAAGVIAAEKMNNIGLGLRFLTAASKAEGCEPDRGDTLVANLNPASKRACTIIHRRAIKKAVETNGWKLAVKLLMLMIERGLTPSQSVWRSVVICCAKAEKSQRATALLLDWVDLYKQGQAEKPPLSVFNTVVNACEVCGEEELTVKVLDTMSETHETEGNLITFNIALKRLAKQGNTRACEGIILGMLQAGIEPSVVTYTTAIAACVADPKQSDTAMEWIGRMKSRLVRPNVITYNTAFASCMDGSIESTTRASELASSMITDVKEQVDSGIIDRGDYTNIIPNYYTISLAKDLVKQLDELCAKGKFDEELATQTRVPLLELVDYFNSDLSELAEKQKNFVNEDEAKQVTDGVESTTEDSDGDDELEYYTAITAHRAAVV